jgi:hypothetical protein
MMVVLWIDQCSTNALQCFPQQTSQSYNHCSPNEVSKKGLSLISKQMTSHL